MLCFQLAALPPNGLKKSNKYKGVILFCFGFNTTKVRKNNLTVARTESGSLNALISIVHSFRQLFSAQKVSKPKCLCCLMSAGSVLYNFIGVNMSMLCLHCPQVAQKNLFMQV